MNRPQFTKICKKRGTPSRTNQSLHKEKVVGPYKRAQILETAIVLLRHHFKGLQGKFFRSLPDRDSLEDLQRTA